MPALSLRFVLKIVAVLLVLAIPTASLALMELEFVSPQRAKELGMEIRYNAAGPEAVRVYLEFAAAGQLKDYARVDLEIHQNGKLLLTSILREEQAKPGRIIVSFAADRANLDKITLRVVTQSAPRTMTGLELRMKDFVDLKEIR